MLSEDLKQKFNLSKLNYMRAWQIYLNLMMASFIYNAFYYQLRTDFQHLYHIILYALHLYFLAFSFKKDQMHFSIYAAIIFQVRTLFTLVEDSGKILKLEDT